MRRANAITHRNAERLVLDMCIIKCVPHHSSSMQADRYRFFMFVVHNKRGDIGLEAATFGEAQYIAICLGMHREDVSSISLVHDPELIGSLTIT
jgi:hypothetical protein